MINGFGELKFATLSKRSKLRYQVSNFDGVVLEIVIWSQRILKQNKHKSYTPMWVENRHSDFGDQWEIGPE